LIDEIYGIYQRHYINSSYQFIHDFFRAVFRRIYKAPTVDAVEVVHGRWEKVKQDLGDGITTYRFGCSECGYLKNTLTGNYCPNCGAKMDGDGNG
jgi:rubrerythrin